jgi:hypothetical protein
LRVSKTGRATMAASRAAFASINGRIENELSQQEIKRLAEFLDRLTAAFEAGV